MTINFLSYGYTPNPPRTITSIHVQEQDNCDDVIETFEHDIAELRHNFDEAVGNLTAENVSMRGQLKQVKEGLTLLENAGNHNTKVASDEFKKIEQAFDRGHARIAALENSHLDDSNARPLFYRIEKLERTALTRQEVEAFVSSTRSRLEKIETTVLTDADVKTFVDNTRRRLSELENRANAQDITNRKMAERLFALERGNTSGHRNRY